jgi:hypothetical protein
MHWNGHFAALPFIWHFEYTRNLTFAKTATYPLLDGLNAWTHCFLQRREQVYNNGSIIVTKHTIGSIIVTKHINGSIIVTKHTNGSIIVTKHTNGSIIVTKHTNGSRLAEIDSGQLSSHFLCPWGS